MEKIKGGGQAAALLGEVVEVKGRLAAKIVTKIYVTPKTLFLMNHVHGFRIYHTWRLNSNVSIILDEGRDGETEKKKTKQNNPTKQNKTFM